MQNLPEPLKVNLAPVKRNDNKVDLGNKELWSFNTPARFWHCQDNLPESMWQEAYARSFHLLGLTLTDHDIDSILAYTLGEGRFGSDHWELDTFKRTYYLVKPLIPRPIIRNLRRIYNRGVKTQEDWPIEHRYVDFLWEVLRQIMVLSSLENLSFRCFWPEHKGFAFVLTHDIETAAGQEFVKVVADLEENLGFRSSFNFVPEKYKPNHELMDDLRQRGFEVGVHGLKHDGKLFFSKQIFMQNANRINRYLKEWNAVGFRAELTHRQPEWMQALEIEYDLSFFDTDPFEPIPGGTMSIWPFSVGHFLELPYTLVQDYTLTSVLGEKSPRFWLDKVDYIEKYHGMALLNSHPDYLKSKPAWDMYHEFLGAIKRRSGYWHALPGEVTRWWKSRMLSSSENNIPDAQLSRVLLDGKRLKIEV